MSDARATRDALRDAVLERDHAAIGELLAEDAVLRSPVLRFPFEGRAAVADVYRVVLEGFESFEHLESLGDAEGRQMLRFRSRVLGRDGEIVTLLDIDARGKVREVVIYVRPLATLAAVAAVMGPGLAAARRPRYRLVMLLLARWLPPVIELADPLIPRLIRLRSGGRRP